jgi:hypothetical protein
MAMIQLLVWLKQSRGSSHQIQPVIPPPTLGSKAKIQVESIDIADYPAHSQPHGFVRRR